MLDIRYLRYLSITYTNRAQVLICRPPSLRAEHRVDGVLVVREVGLLLTVPVGVPAEKRTKSQISGVSESQYLFLKLTGTGRMVGTPGSS